MAHSLSSRKRIRQNVTARLRNRSRRSALRSRLRTATEAIQTGQPQTADQVRAAIALLDREANRGLIHPNTAARKKSQLARKLNQAKSK